MLSETGTCQRGAMTKGTRGKEKWRINNKKCLVLPRKAERRFRVRKKGQIISQNTKRHKGKAKWD